MVMRVRMVSGRLICMVFSIMLIFLGSSTPAQAEATFWVCVADSQYPSTYVYYSRVFEIPIPYQYVNTDTPRPIVEAFQEFAARSNMGSDAARPSTKKGCTRAMNANSRESGGRPAGLSGSRTGFLEPI